MVARKSRPVAKSAWVSPKPLIGITCEVHPIKRYYSEFELFVDYRYIRAVVRAGGLPIIIPVNHFEADIESLLDVIDGIIITGGSDIHPSFYGSIRRTKKINPMYRGRTYFEMHLYRRAQQKKIPVLAICYGLQLLNVIHSGTLYHDIKMNIRGSRNHCTKRHPLHRIRVIPGSLCEKIFKRRSILVHSEHHQAVRKLGDRLKIGAVSEDGIIEALEGPPWTMAVQWHPERQPKDPMQKRLFQFFISWALLRRKRRLHPGKKG